MRIRTWQQALDAHIDYAKWVSDRDVQDEIATTIGTRFLLDMPPEMIEAYAEEGIDEEGIQTLADHKESCRDIGRKLMEDTGDHHLQSCPTVFLTSDMQKLVVAAAETIDPYPFALSDLFVPHGLVLFADLLPEPMMGGETDKHPLRGFGWTTSKEKGRLPAVTIHRFIDTDSFDEEFQVGVLTERPRTPIMPVEIPAPWTVGSSFTQHRFSWKDNNEELDDELTRAVTEASRRFLSALFALMRQKLPTIESPHPPRQLAKRSFRQFGPDHEIKVVTLRRRQRHEVEGEPGFSDRAYSHRWMTAGHWRNQYYPSLGGSAILPDGSQDPANHRPIFIDDYIAGPEHLPLVLKDTVYKVVR